jgi:hypothetical protein
MVKYFKITLLALNLPTTKELYSNFPLIYVYDDNDFPKISDGTYKINEVQAVTKAYRKIFPSYDLPDNVGAYQSFRNGNSLFLVTDSRAFLDLNNGNLFGKNQLDWVINNLKQASQDPSINAVFITITQAWNHVKSAYDWDIIKQKFYSILDVMTAEKEKVSEAARNNFNFSRPNKANFKSLMMIIGEHTLAFDDGTWNNYGNFPIAVCGPLAEWQQCRGGPYSHGSFHNEQSQYCVFTVYPNADLKNTCVKAEGIVTFKDTDKQEIVVWTYDTCYPDKYRGRVNLKCPILFTEKIVNAAITIGVNIFIFLIFFVVIYKLSLKAFSFNIINLDNKQVKKSV